MREEGVFLKYRIDLSLMGRYMRNFGTVKVYCTGCGCEKTADNTQCGGFAASAGTKQRQKFAIINCKIQVIENKLVVKRHAAIYKANQLFGHLSSPVS